MSLVTVTIATVMVGFGVGVFQKTWTMTLEILSSCHESRVPAQLYQGRNCSGSVFINDNVTSWRELKQQRHNFRVSRTTRRQS